MDRKTINTGLNVFGIGMMLFIGLGLWSAWYEKQEDAGWKAARVLWFSECKGTTVNCAAAWDKSRTLRELYRDRSE